MKRAKASFIVLMLATVVGAGCSNVSVASSPLAITSIHELSEIDLLPGEMLRVVVTTSILGDVVANVAGENVDLQVLLPAGADPHSYQPTPQDLRTIAEAHVLFINGLGLEIFLQDALANAGGQAIVISLSDGVPARTISSHDLEPHDVHDENFSDVDAHVWLDPGNVEIWVDNAQVALATLDPGNGGRYLASANDYKALLHDLDIWIQEQVAQIPQAERKLVTDHMALAYFAERYGFDIVGAVIPSYNTTAEVSAQELVALQQTIRAAGVQAIFVAVGTNPAISRQLSIDLGLHLVPIYIGALSDAPGPAASYIDLMHYNVEAIVDALRL